MARKKNKMQFQNFESKENQGRFIRIAYDMFESKAWKELSLRQSGLYLLLKSKYVEKKVAGSVETSNKDNISFTAIESLNFYGDKRTFWTDIDALINLGFIKVINHGYMTRECNIYGFSERWKLYGTDKFHIPSNEKRYKKQKAKIIKLVENSS